MDPVEMIEAARARLELSPPATVEQIAAVEREAGAPLPAELRAILAHTRAIEGPLDVIDFTGEHAFEYREIFPHGLPLAGDGFGNFWVADLLPGEHEHAAVFFASHDPPVVHFESPSVTEWLQVALREGPFAEWTGEPAALSREEAPAAFAQSVDGDFDFYDLRDPRPGMGFEWGAAGPRARVVRDGTGLLFAVQRRQRRGLLGRLRSAR